jgi:hypothetical protein
MSLSEDVTKPAENQATSKPYCRKKRPRTRECLLRGCGRSFRPSRALARYCSRECSAKARQWSRWKAQDSYRKKASGKAKRQAQCCRYRERLKKRGKEGCPSSARVITRNFFRMLLRPSGVLRVFCCPPPVSTAALLQPRLPTGAAAGFRARAALENTSQGTWDPCAQALKRPREQQPEIS